MSSAKQSVLDMIARKEKRIKQLRKGYAQHVGPEQLVADFMKMIDAKRIACVNFMDFEDLIKRESRLLEQKLHNLDQLINIRIVWNNEEKTEDWKDLQIEAIHLTWSQDWRDKNPTKDGELYIDMGTLFLEGKL